MCSGRVDLDLIFGAFEGGYEGVLVGGCMLNACNYVTQGNYDALGNVLIGRAILKRIGVDSERLDIAFMSGGDGKRLADVVTAFTAKVKPLEKTDAFTAVRRLVPFIKLVEREKLRVPERTEAAYRRFFESKAVNRVLDDLVGWISVCKKTAARHGWIEPDGDANVEEIIDRHQAEPRALIQILLDIQKERNWLPPAALKRVSERLKVPMTRVQHVATFYKAFSMIPKGRHRVSVCVGTACHVRGANRILETVQDHAKIGPGESDRDLKFSLETVGCLGCCALGPVVDINGKIHGRATKAKTTQILEKCT